MTIPLDGGLVRQRTAPRAERGEYGAARQLWSSIPGELAEKMAPLSGAMVRDVIREIRRAVPAYAQPLEGKFREVLVGAVEMAIVKCFDTIANPDAAQTDVRGSRPIRARTPSPAGLIRMHSAWPSRRSMTARSCRITAWQACS